MKFKAKKRYGQSKIVYCPFCSRIATQKNDQGVEVCYQHRQSGMQEIKCLCGTWLEQKSGKFGPYFNCIKCGNINFQKGLEMKDLPYNKQEEKPIQSIEEKRTFERKLVHYKKEKKEITITSHDLEYFD